MGWIRFLRALLGFVFLFSLMAAIGSPVYLFVASERLGFSFNVGGILIRNIDSSFYVVISLVVLSQFLFVYMIHHLKKASWLLAPRKAFAGGLSRHLHLAGIACVIGALLNRLPAFIYKYWFFKELRGDSGFSEGLNFGFSFDSLLVLIVFGVFLIVLSKIISVSSSIKEENDLTI